MKFSALIILSLAAAGCGSTVTYQPSLNDPDKWIRELTPADIELISFDWTFERVVEEFGPGDIPEIVALLYPVKGEQGYYYHFSFEPDLPGTPLWAVARNVKGPDGVRIVWPPKWAGKKFERLPPFEERQ